MVVGCTPEAEDDAAAGGRDVVPAATDCRNAGAECGSGFECLQNAEGAYECLRPQAGEAGTPTAPMGAATAASAGSSVSGAGMPATAGQSVMETTNAQAGVMGEGGGELSSNEQGTGGGSTSMSDGPSGAGDIATAGEMSGAGESAVAGEPSGAGMADAGGNEQTMIAGQPGDVPACADVDCGDSGRCVDGACECEDGFLGRRCETELGALTRAVYGRQPCVPALEFALPHMVNASRSRVRAMVSPFGALRPAGWHRRV